MLDQVVGQMLAQRKIFLMHERNQAALEKLHRREHEAEHEDIQNKLRRVLDDTRVPVADRVKMAAAVGVVFSSLFSRATRSPGCPTRSWAVSSA